MRYDKAINIHLNKRTMVHRDGLETVSLKMRRILSKTVFWMLEIDWQRLCIKYEGCAHSCRLKMKDMYRMVGPKTGPTWWGSAPSMASIYIQSNNYKAQCRTNNRNLIVPYPTNQITFPEFPTLKAKNKSKKCLFSSDWGNGIGCTSLLDGMFWRLYYQ